MSKLYKIMGVINVTPDSFSDGGKFNQTEKAVAWALDLIKQGADIIDIGGESTRPGAEYVTVEEEIKRIVPVIKDLRAINTEVTISIDTSKPAVMQAAIAVGANFINDVNALQSEGAVEVVAKNNLPVCLMHKKGKPKSMQVQPHYADVLIEVMDFFKMRIDECLASGIQHKNIILDPGIGFGKTLEHNLTLLKSINQIRSLGFPVLIGASRKTLIGEILNAQVDGRLFGSLAVAQFAYMQGAEYLRVHDVKATSDVLKITQKLIN